MMVILGMTLASILIVAAVHSALRSALYGVTLSNGVDVLVTRDVYAEIVRQYEALALDIHDDWKRWDRAVLETLRLERPLEWRYLLRSLGQHVPGELHSIRRTRQVVHR